MAARRSGPFAMVYGPWADAWSGVLTGREYGLLLVLCGNLTFDAEGSATARVGERLIAERMGCSVNVVRKAKSGLARKGFLSVAEPARGRRPATLAVMPGIPWPCE